MSFLFSNDLENNTDERLFMEKQILLTNSLDEFLQFVFDEKSNLITITGWADLRFIPPTKEEKAGYLSSEAINVKQELINWFINILQKDKIITFDATKVELMDSKMINLWNVSAAEAQKKTGKKMNKHKIIIDFNKHNVMHQFLDDLNKSGYEVVSNKI